MLNEPITAIHPQYYNAMQKACRLGGPLAPHLHLSGYLLRPLGISCLTIWGKHSCPPTERPHYMMQICLSGSADFTLGGTERIRPGTVCLVPPGATYTWQTGVGGAFLLWFDFQTDPPLNLREPGLWPVLPDVLQDLNVILHEIEEAKTGWRERVGWRFTLILGQVVTLAEKLTTLPSHPKLNDYLTHVVDQYLNDHLAYPVTITEIAEAVNIPLRTLVRRYKENCGCTMMASMRKFRLTKAEELLRDTGLSLEEVAIHVGIPDKSHFCRLFRAQYGESPMAYQRRCQQK